MNFRECELSERMSAALKYLDDLRKLMHSNALVKKYSDLIESKTKVKIEYFAAGIIALLTVFVFFGIGADIICNIVGFVYPMISTIKSIESNEDATFWLTYWVVFGFFGMMDTVIDIVLYWIPFFYAIKLVFLVWCMHPQSRGAEQVYKRLILPQFEKHKDKIDEALKSTSNAFSRASESISGKKAE